VKSKSIGWLIGVLLVASCGRQESPPKPAPTPPRAPATVRDTRLEMYELQEKCAKDAHDWYKRDWEDVPAPNIVSSYTNHYNSRLEKCFVIVSSTLFGKEKKTGVEYSVNSKTLVDVLEHRDIGAYDESSRRAQPMQCKVDDAPCAGADQWDALAKPYMDE
jgi:hypothetical protein